MQLVCEWVHEAAGVVHEKYKIEMSPEVTEYLNLDASTKPEVGVQFPLNGLKYLKPGNGLNVRFYLTVVLYTITIE